MMSMCAHWLAWNTLVRLFAPHPFCSEFRGQNTQQSVHRPSELFENWLRHDLETTKVLQNARIFAGAKAFKRVKLSVKPLSFVTSPSLCLGTIKILRILQERRQAWSAQKNASTRSVLSIPPNKSSQSACQVGQVLCYGNYMQLLYSTLNWSRQFQACPVCQKEILTPLLHKTVEGLQSFIYNVYIIKLCSYESMWMLLNVLKGIGV